MPNAQALQFFYGSIPVLLFLGSIFFRLQLQGSRDTLLLKDILDRLGRMETKMDSIKDELARLGSRLVVLETRAGVIHHG